MQVEGFASIYTVLLHSRTEVWFSLQSLLKFVPVHDIEAVYHKAGYIYARDDNTPIARYICTGLRWFNTNGLTNKLLEQIEAYANKSGKRADFMGDYHREMVFESEDYCS